jgi:NADPH2:quinone reductase
MNDELLIDVRAFGINRLDLEMKKRHTNIGVEVCGVVLEAGSSLFKVGDKVCALVTEGGYQKTAKASIHTTFHLPSHLDFSEGAALPESLFTLALNLWELGRLKSGETLFIHSATGGIGDMGIKLARASGVTVMASSSRNTDILSRWGAVRVFTSSLELQSESIDVILDNSGSQNFSHHIKALNQNGRLAMIDAYTGEESTIELGAVLDKSLQITGTLLRPRTLLEKEKTKNIIVNKLLPLIDEHKIRPHLHKVFSGLSSMDAHAVLEARSHLGKLIGVHA